MKKTIGLLLLGILSVNLNYGQTCDCAGNFEWVKKTFEENDAGFSYVMATKGAQAYASHNQHFAEKVKAEHDLVKCSTLLYEWLTFFRSGHIAIRINEKLLQSGTTQQAKNFDDWESRKVDVPAFEKYLERKQSVDYEGIWASPPYKIGIRKEGKDYIGFIIASEASTWTKGQVKLKITPSGDKDSAVLYLRDHSTQPTDVVELIGKNHLRVGAMSCVRVAPKLEDDELMLRYLKSLYASKPYLEQLSPTTLLLRIPSFKQSAKKDIDSVLATNRAKILSTENLIIDITNGTGGDDDSYAGILPFLYTNPIRAIGVEYLSTKLNNQRMLDFINKPEYGFDDTRKKWARTSYDELTKKPGQFVNLGQEIVGITRMDTIYPFPKNVGIIINNGNGSTDEQFLLDARQSRKVKLFGRTTFGVLDISNMYFVESPGKEFTLGYALSRSMRIPDMTIDGKGIPPDYFLDKSIPEYKWVAFVEDVLNGK